MARDPQHNEGDAAPAAPPAPDAAPVAPIAPGPEGDPELAPEGSSELAPEDADVLAPEAAEEGASDHSARDVEVDLDELVVRAERADEYLALAQRTQADFENYRKRMAREVGAAEARGLTKLARELMPALDNLARALQAVDAPRNGGEAAGSGAGEVQVEGESGADHLAAGVRLVQAEVLAALARVGIEPYSPQGEPFDPQQHEAMAQHPVEGAPSGTVVEVYQQGYRLGESVLRPARVVVAA